MADIHTWADGYGVWHARVLGARSERHALRLALGAITAELAYREPRTFDPNTVAVARDPGYDSAGSAAIAFVEVPT